MNVEQHTMEAYKQAYIQFMERGTMMPRYLLSLGSALADLGVNLDEYDQEIREERAAERQQAEEDARQLAGLWCDIHDMQSKLRDRIEGYGTKYPELEQAGLDLHMQFNAYLESVEAEQCNLSDEYGV